MQFPNDLLPGDVLLYGGTDIVSRLIQFRTWDDVSHIEIYSGHCLSIASRNGIGIDRYPFRAEGLRYVLRPARHLDFDSGMKWFETVKGQPYNWLDLARFYGLNIDGVGMICSQFGAAFFSNCHYQLFSHDYDDGDICPRDFKLAPDLDVAWKWK